MTKKEALWRVKTEKESKENINETHDMLVRLHNATVNEVYNDFENRTCENCKHYDSMNESSGMCNNIVLTFIDAVDYGFGCNKFEIK